MPAVCDRTIEQMAEAIRPFTAPLILEKGYISKREISMLINRVTGWELYATSDLTRVENKLYEIK